MKSPIMRNSSAYYIVSNSVNLIGIQTENPSGMGLCDWLTSECWSEVGTRAGLNEVAGQ